MGHHKSNDELREDRTEDQERRQEWRDDAEDATGSADDLGSQDERRAEGDRQH
jgi:hypothetical protein